MADWDEVPFEPECLTCGAIESRSWVFIDIDNERGLEPGIYCDQCGLGLILPPETTN